MKTDNKTFPKYRSLDKYRDRKNRIDKMDEKVDKFAKIKQQAHKEYNKGKFNGFGGGGYKEIYKTDNFVFLKPKKDTHYSIDNNSIDNNSTNEEAKSALMNHLFISSLLKECGEPILKYGIVDIKKDNKETKEMFAERGYADLSCGIDEHKFHSYKNYGMYVNYEHDQNIFYGKDDPECSWRLFFKQLFFGLNDRKAENVIIKGKTKPQGNCVKIAENDFDVLNNYYPQQYDPKESIIDVPDIAPCFYIPNETDKINKNYEKDIVGWCKPLRRGDFSRHKNKKNRDYLNDLVYFAQKFISKHTNKDWKENGFKIMKQYILDKDRIVNVIQRFIYTALGNGLSEKDIKKKINETLEQWKAYNQFLIERIIKKDVIFADDKEKKNQNLSNITDDKKSIIIKKMVKSLEAENENINDVYKALNEPTNFKTSLRNNMSLSRYYHGNMRKKNTPDKKFLRANHSVLIKNNDDMNKFYNESCKNRAQECKKTHIFDNFQSIKLDNYKMDNNQLTNFEGKEYYNLNCNCKCYII